MQNVCIYVRPMLGLSVADQLATLSAWAEASGHHVAATFVEPERKRGTDHRREASRMLAEAARGHWDRVACVSLLALCRSVRHASEVLGRLSHLGIPLTAVLDGVDTGSDDGRTAAALDLAARLEHAVHVERATIGARRRIEAGFKHGRPRLAENKEARVVALIKAGTSTERITRVVGCGKSAVYRIRDELKAAAP